MNDHGDRTTKNAFNVERHVRNMAKSEQRNKLKESSKNLKRNLKPTRPNQTKWSPRGVEDWDGDDFLQTERIMPRDEGDRRRAVTQAAYRRLDNSAGDAGSTPPVAGKRGLVLEASHGLCRVDLDGQTLLCQIRSKLVKQRSDFANVVATGDEVIVSEDGAGGGIVEAVLPRRSMLARSDRHLRQIVVANVDQLLIVASWREPTIWLELIDRYLIAAERSDLPAIICVNKVDLVDDAAALHETLQPYRKLDYQIMLVSARTGEGIDAMRAVLHDRTSVVAGLSGVGKSSLLTAVQPGLQLDTGDVSDWWRGEGRHTTTLATLLRLDGGGAVVDTPGIREFGLSGVRQHELVAFFPEIASRMGTCRFANCTHLNEPGCAVRDAVASGAMAKSRYHSFKQIHASLPA